MGLIPLRPFKLEVVHIALKALQARGGAYRPLRPEELGL